jgi:type IV pilus assembly protein PilE
MDRSRGFSMVELLAVMAIAAVLAALAVRSYSRYTIRSRRFDAHQTLVAIAQAQERWYATYHRYADDLGKLGYADPAIAPHGHYEVTMSVVDNDERQGFVVTATPIGRQEADVCGSLSIDSAGRKLPGRENTGANANGNCW